MSPTLAGGFFTVGPPKKPTSRYQNNGKKEGKGNHTKNEGNGETQIFFLISRDDLFIKLFLKLIYLAALGFSSGTKGL